MAKKKPQKRGNEHPKQQEDKLSVLDHLDQNVFVKLKEKQQELKQREDREKAAQKEVEEERKRIERKQREKNKSFAELLGESDLDWRKFK